MKLRQLEQFIAVCETGSISRASAQLHIAQPALGLQIRQLEEEFGSPLLVRHPRGAQPTAAGEIVLAWARTVLDDARTVKQRVRALDTPEPASLSLGMSPSTSSMLGSKLLAGAQAASPALKLRLVEELSHILVEWVKDERLDLALLFDCDEYVPASSLTLASETLYFVTSSAHAAKLPKGDTIALRSALAWPLAMPTDVGSVRRAVEAAAKTCGLPVHVLFEIQSMDVIRGLLRRGEASAIIPYGFAHHEIAEGRLEARLVVDPPVSRTLRLVRSATCPPSERTAALERLIRTELRAASAGSAHGYQMLAGQGQAPV